MPSNKQLRLARIEAIRTAISTCLSNEGGALYGQLVVQSLKVMPDVTERKIKEYIDLIIKQEDLNLVAGVIQR